MTILSWMEMPEEDQPPERLWLDDQAIAEHFEKVRIRYKEKYSGAGTESVPEADSSMTDNEHVRQFMR